jgi:L-lactate dehydrogenase complex protein LldG
MVEKAQPQMTEREIILERVKEALKLRSPHPVPPEERDILPQPPSAGARRWLPQVGEHFKDWVDSFSRNATELKVDFQLMSSSDEMRQALVRLREAQGWKRAATHGGLLPDAMCPALGVPMVNTSGPFDVHALETCDVGITECDALVAQTGSVVVSSRRAGGRSLSILPPHHVVLARRDQLVPDLPAAFELLRSEYGHNFPSMISFITGPSRTGNIERTPVPGGLGPNKLTILCI